jgi:hypothetical protein
MTTQLTTMTIADAKQCVKYGAKITHPLWNENEFITRHWRTGYLTNENETLIDANKFWANIEQMGEAFENGFQVYVPASPINDLLSNYFIQNYIAYK